jgi:hypothetical protein
MGLDHSAPAVSALTNTPQVASHMRESAAPWQPASIHPLKNDWTKSLQSIHQSPGLGHLMAMIARCVRD